jgi:hypothetical protein
VGFGAPDDIPSPFKQAIKMLAAYYYNHREAAESKDMPQEIEYGIRKLVGRWKFAKDHS